MKTKTAAIILAAGQGKRMRSNLPKVLHRCADFPLVGHVIELAIKTRCEPIVVVIDKNGQSIKDELSRLFEKHPLTYAIQTMPLGTADAVRAGLTKLSNFAGHSLVLYGDVPLIQPATIRKLSRSLKARSCFW